MSILLPLGVPSESVAGGASEDGSADRHALSRPPSPVQVNGDGALETARAQVKLLVPDQTRPKCFYPQALEVLQGDQPDADQLSRATTLYLRKDQRLQVGRVVPDPEGLDPSNPQARSSLPFLPLQPAPKEVDAPDSWTTDSDQEEPPETNRSGANNVVGKSRARQQSLISYSVVSPVYPWSVGSLFFPIHYSSRLSQREASDVGGLPAQINLNTHGVDRPHMVLRQIHVKKNNLNKMCLYKIGPGAVAFRVVLSAFEAAGMQYTPSNEHFNVLWAKRVTPYTLSHLGPYQKVNHFPGTSGIGRKDSLAMNIAKMKKQFGEDAFDIVPKSYILPRQYNDLKADAAKEGNSTKNPLVYISKPTASSCGRGIRLHLGIPVLSKTVKEVVCQRYIGNPLLIHGRKFDIRMYCVVTSFDPLRIYLFDEGLIRFAAEKYSGPTSDIDNIYKHLTNYAIGKTADLKRHDGNVEEDIDEAVDIKWTISDLRKFYVDNGQADHWGIIEKGIDDAVIKAFLSIEADVVSRVRSLCRDQSGRGCFELLGLDLMADESLKVHLIEVNIMPSLATGSSVDKAVKSRMLAHMLTMLRVVPFSREAVWATSQAGGDSPAATGDAPPSAERESRRRSTVGINLYGICTSVADVGKSGHRGSSQGPVRRSLSNTRSHSVGGRSSVMPTGSVASLPQGPQPHPLETRYWFGEVDNSQRTLAKLKNVTRRSLLTRFNEQSNKDSILSTHETMMLIEAEEEIACAGGFRLIFPLAHNALTYFPYFRAGVTRNNYLLASLMAMKEKAQK